MGRIVNRLPCKFRTKQLGRDQEGEKERERKRKKEEERERGRGKGSAFGREGDGRD